MSKEIHHIPVDASVIYAEFTIPRGFDSSTLVYPDRERFVVTYTQGKAYTALEVVPKNITFTVPWGFKVIKGKQVWQVNGDAIVTSRLPKMLKDLTPVDRLVIKPTSIGQGTYLYTYNEKGVGAGEYIRERLVEKIKTCFKGDKTPDIESLSSAISEDKGVAALLAEFEEKHVMATISVNYVNKMNAPMGEELCIRDVADRYLSSVVSIRTSGSSGTGFVIQKSDSVKCAKLDVFGNLVEGEEEDIVTLTLLTCAHVLRESYANPRARFSNGIVDYEIKNIEPLASYDLAICEICVPKAIADAADAIPLNSKAPENGDGVVLIGNNLGVSIVKLFGNVGDPFYKKNFLQTDVNSNPGCSGGPILNNNGNCIGILCKRESISPDGTNIYHGIALATPTYKEGAAIDKIKQALKNKGGNS